MDKVGEVTVIGLNRPDKRNCINHWTAMKLKEALEKFEMDNSSCAAVIHGTGGNFCAGTDLREFSNLDSKNLDTSKIFPLVILTHCSEYIYR